MNLDLSQAEHAFRAEVQAFLRDNLTPAMIAGQQMSAGVFPVPAVSLPWQRALAARGWAAPLWPVAHGGTGWTPIERFIFETECARAGAPTLYPIGIRLVAPVLIAFGDEDQRRRWLPRILSGDDYWCQGFSEPGAGSDLAALQTRAMVQGDDYIVNGSKIWTTHAHFSTHMFALVRTAHGGKPREGITVLAIELDRPGVNVRPILSLSGEHDVNQIFLDDVRVPVSNRIGEENRGWDYAKYLLEFERGAGFASGRLRFGLQRIAAGLAPDGADDSYVRDRIAEIAIEIDTFEMLEMLTLGALRTGQRPGPASSMLKLLASRLKQKIGVLGVEALADDRAIWPEHPATVGETLVADFLNSRAATIFGGASEVQLGIIARSLVRG